MQDQDAYVSCENLACVLVPSRETEPMPQPPFRPEGHVGTVEPHLPGVEKALMKAMDRALKGLKHDTLKLDKPSLNSAVHDPC